MNGNKFLNGFRKHIEKMSTQEILDLKKRRMEVHEFMGERGFEPDQEKSAAVDEIIEDVLKNRCA